MSDERHEYEPVSQWYGSAWWVKLSDYNNLARQLRERDERIGQLDREGVGQAEQIVKLCDSLLYIEGILRRAGRPVDPDADLTGQITAYVGELEARAESAERKLAEAEEALGLVVRHPHVGFLMRANIGDPKNGRRFQDLSAVRRALGREEG